MAAARGRSNQSAWEFPVRHFLEIREYTEEPLGTAWRSNPRRSILLKQMHCNYLFDECQAETVKPAVEHDCGDKCLLSGVITTTGFMTTALPAQQVSFASPHQ